MRICRLLFAEKGHFLPPLRWGTGGLGFGVIAPATCGKALS
jgi:hypothetical protein